MRKILLGFVLVAPTAFGGVKFYGDLNVNRPGCVGDKIHMDQYNYRLASTVKCELPIMNANQYNAVHIKRPGGGEQFGCWAKTLGGKALIIISDGTTETWDMLSFVEVDVDKTGNGKIIKSYFQRAGFAKCPTR
ncbi:hypothetical protein ACIQVE_07025 [Pseudomonas sp. NPDC098747]|uniref:hypothetical protein n=1 Tax=Pseudomonas sp. NPDC098747 TaxID=3364487 RepID=UPI003839E926